MIEVYGDLWSYPADVRVITTNGMVRKDGGCVMGRGCALEAKNRYKGIDLVLGRMIKVEGNHVHFLMAMADFTLYSYPVKHKWFEAADPDLIVRSAEELAELVHGDSQVVLPRPGCGNGSLKWDQVKPLLEKILDDRFHVITFDS